MYAFIFVRSDLPCLFLVYYFFISFLYLTFLGFLQFERNPVHIKNVFFLFSFNFLTLVTLHEIVCKVCHLSLLESRLLATDSWLVWRWNSLVTSRSLFGVWWKSMQAFCVCVSAKRRCLFNYVLSAITSVTKRFPSGVTWVYLYSRCTDAFPNLVPFLKGCLWFWVPRP